MSLITRLLDVVRSWRRGRSPRKADRRSAVSMEHLDHRQLLSVNFTGNVATDFPASMTPGVVVLPNTPSVIHPTIAPDLAPIVKVSGFDINGIRVTYTPETDTLSVGIEQPPSQQAGQPGSVVAGDADNNGNDGTVSAAVLAVNPTFQDYPDFAGSEYMGIFLDLKGTGFADVVAGYSINDPRSPKQFQVADAVVDTNQPPTTLPDFGTPFPLNTGNVYKVNSPAHPNLEFDIANFSKLYLQETGKTLNANTVIRLGGFAGSQEDTGIGEAYFPAQQFTLGQATPPPTPPCPPASPPVIINPHANRHIDTAHDTPIRASIFGSSGFDVTKIIPSTVTLGGAKPVFGFDRFINEDEFLDATFVFRGTDVNLPAGFTDATISGALTDGTTFSSSVRVFNRDSSSFTPAEIQHQHAVQLARDARFHGAVTVPGGSPITTTTATSTATSVPVVGTQALRIPVNNVNVDYGQARPAAMANRGRTTAPQPAPSGPVVAIERREPVVAGQGQRVDQRARARVNRMVDDFTATDLTEIASHGAH